MTHLIEDGVLVGGGICLKRECLFLCAVVFPCHFGLKVLTKSGIPLLPTPALPLGEVQGSSFSVSQRVRLNTIPRSPRAGRSSLLFNSIPVASRRRPRLVSRYTPGFGLHTLAHTGWTLFCELARSRLVRRCICCTASWSRLLDAEAKLSPMF